MTGRAISALLALGLLGACGGLPLASQRLIQDAVAPPDGGEVWVLLVAGSSGYMNYRHQADICHAYQIVHSHGVKDERIIVMMYDDVAHSFFNPYKGALFNEPNGTDVYANVPRDYTGRHVTPHNFMAVLTGDAAKVKGGSGRVIQSGPLDRVFVYFADHGAPGFLAFPTRMHVWPTQLNSRDVIKGLKGMRAAGRFSQLVFYVEACESGSMFNNVLSADIRVLAVTAATPFESSFACYYNSTLGTYIGDCFSNHWMENSDTFVLQAETIELQVARVARETVNSTVCMYGDLTISQQAVANFLGGYMPFPEGDAAGARTHKRGGGEHLQDAVDSRDVTLEVLRRRVASEEALVSRGAGDAGLLSLTRHALAQEEEARRTADALFEAISVGAAESIYDGSVNSDGAVVERAAEILRGPFPPKPNNTCTGRDVDVRDWFCYEGAIREFDQSCGGFSDYSLRYARVLLRACNAGAPLISLQGVIRSACTHTVRDALAPNIMDYIDSDPPPPPTPTLAAPTPLGSPKSVCHSKVDEGACMAEPTCTWCVCKAVPSKCFTRDEATKLPPAVFKCDP